MRRLCTCNTFYVIPRSCIYLPFMKSLNTLLLKFSMKISTLFFLFFFFLGLGCMKWWWIANIYEFEARSGFDTFNFLLLRTPHPFHFPTRDPTPLSYQPSPHHLSSIVPNFSHNLFSFHFWWAGRRGGERKKRGGKYTVIFFFWGGGGGEYIFVDFRVLTVQNLSAHLIYPYIKSPHQDPKKGKNP